ncbi:MAG: hypothetical protein Q8J78_08895 [Moraxellaceae bacterium]|nr:hypothetical protein [Moraxellaceae bacterium]
MSVPDYVHHKLHQRPRCLGQRQRLGANYTPADGKWHMYVQCMECAFSVSDASADHADFFIGAQNVFGEWNRLQRPAVAA